MGAKPFNIGIDVGGTNIKFCVTNERGTILSQHKIRTATEAGSYVLIQSIVDNIQVMLEQTGITLSKVNSIGLGIPGTTDSIRGVIVFAPNIFMVNCEIVKTIQLTYDLPVYVVQDTRAAAWGEYMVGGGKGLSSIASVTLGTGIGCGMVINGKIFHGALNTAGEFGHQIVEVDGNQCNCGRRGCLEAYAGGLAIVREAKESIAGLSNLLKKSVDSVSVEDVFGLAKAGNEQARRVTDKVVKYVGIGLVNLINITSPELVSISGGICNAPPELLINPLVEFVRRRAYPTISEAIKICRSPLRDAAPLIGAALLYREAPRYAAVEVNEFP
jgi:glucokinase